MTDPVVTSHIDNFFSQDHPTIILMRNGHGDGVKQTTGDAVSGKNQSHARVGLPIVRSFFFFVTLEGAAPCLWLFLSTKVVAIQQPGLRT